MPIHQTRNYLSPKGKAELSGLGEHSRNRPPGTGTASWAKPIELIVVATGPHHGFCHVFFMLKSSCAVVRYTQLVQEDENPPPRVAPWPCLLELQVWPSIGQFLTSTVISRIGASAFSTLSAANSGTDSSLQCYQCCMVKHHRLKAFVLRRLSTRRSKPQSHSLIS